jgi:alpha-L-fucosidase
MKKIFSLILSFSLMSVLSCHQSESKSHVKIIKYEADWESLKQYECPEWFRDAKLGIYTHWGPYSVPSWENEWYPRLMYINEPAQKDNSYTYHKKTWGDVSEFGYKDFIPLFTAEKFNADEWADLFKKSGAKFAGPVAQHHDGFVMWNSDLTTWDAMDMGPHRDILKELSEAVRARDMKFVTSFHHAFNWKYYEPSYELEKTDTKDPLFTGVDKIYPPVHEPGAPASQEFLNMWLAKTKEVVDKYQPDYLWFDFCWGEPEFESYKKEFLAYYYNKAQEWGKDIVVTYKNNNLPPGVAILDLERGKLDTLSKEPWITDTSVDLKSWCYITDPEYKTVNSLIDDFIDIVSKNGNLLLNIGPRPDGTIPDEQAKLLLGIGEWLSINGEAIYGTRPWKMYGEGPTKMVEGHMTEWENKGKSFTAKDIRFTTDENNLYAICLDWPEDGHCLIKCLNDQEKISVKGIKTVSMLGVEGNLEWEQDHYGLHITFPETKPCQNAYSLKITLKGDWISHDM